MNVLIERHYVCVCVCESDRQADGQTVRNKITCTHPHPNKCKEIGGGAKRGKFYICLALYFAVSFLRTCMRACRQVWEAEPVYLGVWLCVMFRFSDS